MAQLKDTTINGALSVTGNAIVTGSIKSEGRYVDRTNDIMLSTVTVANTVTETLLWTGDVDADSLRIGSLLKFGGTGIASNASTADILTLRIKVGGVTKVTLVNSTRNFTDDDVHLTAVATQRTLGATGSRAMHVDFNIGGDASTVNAVGTIDTTANMDVTITAQWNNAKTGNTISLQQGYMEYKN